MVSTKKICRSGQNMLFTHKYECGWIWIWLYLSSSAWGIQLHYNLFWKRIDPKNFLFTETNNWIALAVRWSIKYFFCSEFHNILDKAGRKTKRRRTQSIAKCYAFHSNAILVGLYYTVPKWHYFSCYGIKRASMICLSMKVWPRTLEK